jgi:hypothetical protein
LIEGERYEDSELDFLKDEFFAGKWLTALMLD